MKKRLNKYTIIASLSALVIIAISISLLQNWNNNPNNITSNKNISNVSSSTTNLSSNITSIIAPSNQSISSISSLDLQKTLKSQVESSPISNKNKISLDGILLTVTEKTNEAIFFTTMQGEYIINPELGKNLKLYELPINTEIKVWGTFQKEIGQKFGIITEINKIEKLQSIDKLKTEKINETKNVTSQVNSTIPQMKLPVITENKVTQITAVFYQNKTTNATCSGILNSGKIITIAHCLDSNIALNDEKVIEIDAENHEMLITKNYNLENLEKNVYYVASVDKGLVKGYGKPIPNCSDCPNLFLKLENFLGEGNSGSGVYDWNGKYIGSLSNTSYPDKSFECKAIYYTDLDRWCNYEFTIKYKK